MAEATTKRTESRKPEKVLRAPHGLSASIFANAPKMDGRRTTFYKVSLRKSFRDGEQIRSTSTLSRDELPVAAHLLSQAYAYIVEREGAGPPADGKE